jgi:hypothetical protein
MKLIAVSFAELTPAILTAEHDLAPAYEPPMTMYAVERVAAWRNAAGDKRKFQIDCRSVRF